MLHVYCLLARNISGSIHLIHTSICRDSFIEDDMKPRAKFISESNLEFIFNFDENLQV